MKNFKREEFISIIGFYSNVALVDKKLLTTIRKKSLDTLIKEGYFGPAVRHALYEYQVLNNTNSEDIKKVCDFFDVDSLPLLARRFGITQDILINDDGNSKYSIKFV